MVKLVYGVGNNDAEYVVTKSIELPREEGKRKRKHVWVCPYYSKWIHILERCYSEKFRVSNPTYTGCTINKNWLLLSCFREWVDTQPNKLWYNCELDKDLLSNGSKLYSPETTVFIDKNLNTFLMSSEKSRGDYMIGVCLDKRTNNFQAQCSNPFSNTGKYLGSFRTEIDAHKAWQAKKHEYACIFAGTQEDLRVSKALRERYAPDKDWTNK